MSTITVSRNIHPEMNIEELTSNVTYKDKFKVYSNKFIPQGELETVAQDLAKKFNLCIRKYDNGSIDYFQEANSIKEAIDSFKIIKKAYNEFVQSEKELSMFLESFVVKDEFF